MPKTGQELEQFLVQKKNEFMTQIKDNPAIREELDRRDKAILRGAVEILSKNVGVEMLEDLVENKYATASVDNVLTKRAAPGSSNVISKDIDMTATENMKNSFYGKFLEVAFFGLPWGESSPDPDLNEIGLELKSSRKQADIMAGEITVTGVGDDMAKLADKVFQGGTSRDLAALYVMAHKMANFLFMHIDEDPFNVSKKPRIGFKKVVLFTTLNLLQTYNFILQKSIVTVTKTGEKIVDGTLQRTYSVKINPGNLKDLQNIIQLYMRRLALIDEYDVKEPLAAKRFFELLRDFKASKLDDDFDEIYDNSRRITSRYDRGF